MGCELAGEALRAAFHLPVPGPVIGMMLLTLVLLAFGRPRPDAPTADVVSGLDRTSCGTYFAGAQFIDFLLGPATLALARNIRHVGASLRSVGLALLAGSSVSAVGGIGLVWALGGSRTVALSMAPRAATTPIAMAVSHQIGGAPALTAALVILGGILAAVRGHAC